VGNFTDPNHGDSLTITAGGVVAGTYNVYIGYRSWGAQHNYVKVNGSAPLDEYFAGTNNAWSEHAIQNVTLASGTNTFVISEGWGYMDVDYVRYAPVQTPPPGPGEFPGWGSDPTMPLHYTH